MNVDKNVMKIGASWRNYVSQMMNLNPETFQLALGGLGLQTSDNLGLFLMSDSLPPSSAVNYFSPDNTKLRSGSYGQLLNALLPETDPNALRNALGNDYKSWLDWQQDNKPLPDDTLMARFDRWGMEKGIDPGTMARGRVAIIQAENSTLGKALMNFYSKDATQVFDQSGKEIRAYIYTATIEKAREVINRGQSINIEFDSSKVDSKVDKTFVNGAASGFYKIFSGSGSASFEKLNKSASESKFTIKGRIGKYGTLVTGPAGNWYSSAEVNRASGGKDDNDIWNPSVPSITWDSMFAQPNGQLSRYIQNLVLVSDYEITVTSHASYTKEEFEKIKAEASGGIWPFFKSSGSFSQTRSYNLNKNGTLSVIYKLNKGLTEIWGVNIQNQIQE